MYSEDTIAAISTPPGEGGIGIVRISGKNALDILNRIFVSYKGKSTMQFQSYTMRYGHVYEPDTNKIIDEVLVSYMKSPNTYTKEDVVEIYCHGGMIPLRFILEVVLKYGARLAEPGEFTKRAFLNGRIDLSQAEAVIDIIRSKTEKSSEAAVMQLKGSLSKKLGNIKDKLLNILSHIEASIDFPEDEIEDVLYNKLIKECEEIASYIDDMIKTADTGKILRDGLNTVIIGKPNVGKSSLLNALLEENRAIVTDIPGTTRDVIVEYLNINGVPVNIIDTAGIRETENEIEKIGVERTKEYYKKADLVILILDSSNPFTEEDKNIFELIGNKKCIILINKIDLPTILDRSIVEKYAKDKTIIDVSVKEGKGIESLKNEISKFVYGGQIDYSKDIVVTNIRHKNLLEKANNALKNAVEGIKMRVPIDLISIDIRQCMDYLGEITGEKIQEDIIERIFSQFCIGK